MSTSNVTDAPQNCLILNVDPTDSARKNEYYLFDGVTKVSQVLSSRFDESPDDTSGYRYGAKNDQNKVTMDIIMSDVHDTKSNLTNKRYYDASQSERSHMPASFKNKEGGWANFRTRSSLAAQKLYKIKTERDLLTVFTPSDVFHNMILSNVTINQDEDHIYGWQGQLVFQSKVDQKKKSTGKSGGKKSTGKVKPTASPVTGTGQNLGMSNYNVDGTVVGSSSSNSNVHTGGGGSGR